MIVTFRNIEINRALELLVFQNHVPLVLFHPPVKHRLVPLELDLVLQILGVRVLVIHFLHCLVLLLLLKGFSLALDHGAPFVKLAVPVYRVIPLVLLCQLPDLLSFFFKRFFDAHSA